MPTQHQETMDQELLIQILQSQKVLPGGYHLEFEGTHQGSRMRLEKFSLSNMVKEGKKTYSNPPTVLLCEAETRINKVTLDRERRPLCGDIWFRVMFYDRHGIVLGDVAPPPFADDQHGPQTYNGKTIAGLIRERGIASKVYAALLLCYEDTSIVSYQLMYSCGLKQPIIPQHQQHNSEVPPNTDASL